MLTTEEIFIILMERGIKDRFIEKAMNFRYGKISAVRNGYSSFTETELKRITDFLIKNYKFKL